MIEPAPDGDLALVFVTVVPGSETLPSKNAGQCYVLGQQEVQRLLSELGEQSANGHGESAAAVPAIAPVEHATEEPAVVNDGPARTVLSAYGLLGN